ncbi:YeaH/YhbH family protein [Fontimonas sp. SYSU GA230001]|uniref:YeaH/YhbH family protein n=1 Tax=Fontimonas sp. SYSU GA230001 TaxID=3142450 RepID=UPI0032B49183
MSIIIDRRLNDRNKNAVNRSRFLRRYKSQIQHSVDEMVSKRSITDMEQGGKVNIPIKDISEPTFRHGQGGDREVVHAGNHSFSPGDRLPRPPSGAGGAGGHGEGESEDDFVFSLSREEFMNLFFDDLELPRLARNVLGDVREYQWRRAGYTPSGVPANLAILRSLRNASARRIAVRGAVAQELADVEAQIESAPTPQLLERAELLRKKLEHVPFLDEFDLRFRHRVREPQPVARAAMFCLMDVSASMTEEKKDLAKRFFTLLYLFLSRKYERVELVFIRHTDNAQEVDEQTFFYGTQSGGTVVLSALKLMDEIIEARYDPSSWNIYGAQVSDGDAFGADPEKSRAFLNDRLLPLLRYFAYVEVPDEADHAGPLAHAYARIDDPRFAMKSVIARNEIYPVLRELFHKETA